MPGHTHTHTHTHKTDRQTDRQRERERERQRDREKQREKETERETERNMYATNQVVTLDSDTATKHGIDRPLTINALLLRGLV